MPAPTGIYRLYRCVQYWMGWPRVWMKGAEIFRYFIGLLVFLILLGTFWGLLQTIGSVSTVVSGLDISNIPILNR